VKDEPDNVNFQTAERISAVNAVCVHIRRGDYVSNPTTNQFHGNCSLEYYRPAMGIMALKVEDPNYFIFSDDPEWASDSLKGASSMTTVDHNKADRNYEDLRLMSLCKHHIIANSTFSWWGAWLCKYTGKIVIAPRRWFRDELLNTSDLIPTGWKRI